MPTLKRAGPYRFFVWSNEPPEPAHIHVESGDGHAKFWLGPPLIDPLFWLLGAAGLVLLSLVAKPHRSA